MLVELAQLLKTYTKNTNMNQKETQKFYSKVQEKL